MRKSTAKVVINQVYAAGGVAYSPYSKEVYEEALATKFDGNSESY